MAAEALADNLGDALRQAARPPRDYSPLTARIGELLEESYRACFDGSRDPDGVPWLPLKTRRGRPLVDSGRLRGGGRVRGRTPFSVTLDARDVSYSGYQFEGTRTIPARNAVGVGQADADRIAEMTADFVLEGLGR